MNKIRPIPLKYGIGFFSPEPLPPEMVKGYRYVPTGRYHNYFVTADNWKWPKESVVYDNLIIDGFSPNLNKELHAGHLRNLAIANALSKITNAKMVALLGASLGVKKKALEGWAFWTKFLNYHPEVYYDVLLPGDVLETRKSNFEHPDESSKMEVWDGPVSPVIVVTSDGRKLYAFHDLVFAKEVGPTHYITGHEQSEHFAHLGLKEKHLPMGLVLGSDGKKMKSRSGDAVSANEAIELIMAKLDETPDKFSLAWNILAWNFLSCARESNVKFNEVSWTSPDSPGMYISYTYARLASALGGAGWAILDLGLKEIDVRLLGLAAQVRYYTYRSIVTLDPAPLANFLHVLALEVGKAYHQERIKDGRPAYRYAIDRVALVLFDGMQRLGMFPLTSI